MSSAYSIALPALKKENEVDRIRRLFTRDVELNRRGTDNGVKNVNEKMAKSERVVFCCPLHQCLMTYEVFR